MLRPGLWWLAGSVSLVVVGPGRGPAQEPAAGTSYRSPYRVEWTIPLAELTADLDRTDRGDPHRQSAVPFADWYAPRTRDRWQGWGPPARIYPPPAGLDAWPAARRRERIIAVALRYQGYAYQHHHIPDWAPPADWGSSPATTGPNPKGVDCSNFTAFVYNQGLGLKFTSNIHQQAEIDEAAGPGNGRVTMARRIDLPTSFASRRATLQTGDLVFIRSAQGEVGHVVLWIGSLGRGPDDLPLVIDSHGAGVRDASGHAIPAGIQIRPVREDSWYHRGASHALRLIADVPDPTPRP